MVSVVNALNSPQFLDRLRNDNVSNVVSKSVHGISTAGLVVFLFCDVGIEGDLGIVKRANKVFR